MPGRHASADRSRFRRDLTRLIILVALAVVVAVGAILVVGFLRDGPEEPPASAPTTGEPETVVSSTSSATSSATVAPRSTTTVAAATSTVPTVATTVPETTSTLPPVRAPDRLTVLVLNSTRTPGLAGSLADQLSELGYRTLEPDNHPVALSASVVWYVEGFRREAEVLAEVIPDAVVEPFDGDDPQAPLMVVLGASYRG